MSDDGVQLDGRSTYGQSDECIDGNNSADIPDALVDAGNWDPIADI